MSSSGTCYVLNEHYDIDQYGLNIIQPKLMPCCIYPANLVNQLDYLAFIMPLTNMNKIISMAHMQYRLN